MLTRVGPGSAGYNFSPEFMDWDCVAKIPPSTTLVTGTALCRDVTQVPSSAGADRVCMSNDANAGSVYGIYQGPNIVNSSATATMNVPIVTRQRGFGVVWCNAPTVAVTVGANLVTVTGGPQVNAVAASPPNTTYVGTALATGSNTAKGATIIPVAGAAALVNAYIVCT